MVHGLSRVRVLLDVRRLLREMTGHRWVRTGDRRQLREHPSAGRRLLCGRRVVRVRVRHVRGLAVPVQVLARAAVRRRRTLERIRTAARGSPPLTQSALGRFDDDESLVDTHGNFNYFMNGIINLFQVRSLLAVGPAVAVGYCASS